MVSQIGQDLNRNLTNRTSLIPGAVSPIDDQRLIGVCENFPAAFAHVRQRTATTIGKRPGEKVAVTSGRKRGQGTFTRSSGKMDNRRRRN